MPLRRGHEQIGPSAGGRGRLLARAPGVTLLELLLALAVAAVLLALGVPSYSSYKDRARNAMAASDIARIEAAVELYRTTNLQLPASLAEVHFDTLLDPWGHPYQYLDFTGLKGKAMMRKDRNLVPINSDYDLYSMGKDGASAAPLTAKASQDDIIRAGNGGYVGLAKDF